MENSGHRGFITSCREGRAASRHPEKRHKPFLGLGKGPEERRRGLRVIERGCKEIIVLDLSSPDILMGPKNFESLKLLKRSPTASFCWLLSLLDLLRPLGSRAWLGEVGRTKGRF